MASQGAERGPIQALSSEVESSLTVFPQVVDEVLLGGLDSTGHTERSSEEEAADGSSSVLGSAVGDDVVAPTLASAASGHFVRKPHPALWRARGAMSRLRTTAARKNQRLGLERMYGEVLAPKAPQGRRRRLPLLCFGGWLSPWSLVSGPLLRGFWITFGTPSRGGGRQRVF